jgi:hypothetical protein
MPVEKRYFAAVLNGEVHAFIIDVNNAHIDAERAGDRDGQSALTHLWLHHFDNLLGNMSGPELVEYLESRRRWHEHEGWIVLKTMDEPCIAYTAQKGESGDVTLIALGACYRYPNRSEDEWWRRVILPRLQRL